MPEVAIPLVMSGRADLRKLRADVDDAKVADVRLGFLVGKWLVRGLDFLATVGLLLDSFFNRFQALLLGCKLCRRGATTFD